MFFWKVFRDTAFSIKSYALGKLKDCFSFYKYKYFLQAEVISEHSQNTCGSLGEKTE